MSVSVEKARAWIVAGVRDNPSAKVTDATLLERLADPEADCRFDELGFDSLAAMELCIFIECETRVALSTAELEKYPSVNRLARHLSERAGRRRWFRG